MIVRNMFLGINLIINYLILMFERYIVVLIRDFDSILKVIIFINRRVDEGIIK